MFAAALLLLLLHSQHCYPQVLSSTLIGGDLEYSVPSIIPPTLTAATALLADSAGGLYYAACGGSVVRFVSPALTSTLIAGSCYPNASAPLGNGGPATSARLRAVAALALNATGLFLGETLQPSLRFLSFATGVIVSLAPGPWVGPSCLTWALPPSPFAGALIIGDASGQRAWAYWPTNGTSMLFAGTGASPTVAAYTAGITDPLVAALRPQYCVGLPPNAPQWPGAVLLYDSFLAVLRARLSNGSMLTVAGAAPNFGCTGSAGSPGNTPISGLGAMSLCNLALGGLASTPEGYPALLFRFWSGRVLVLNTSLPFANSSSVAGSSNSLANSAANFARPPWAVASNSRSMNNPSCLAIDPVTGMIYAADMSFSVIAFAPNGTCAVLAGVGSHPGLLPFNTAGNVTALLRPGALSVEPTTGTLLLADIGANVVRAYRVSDGSTASPTGGDGLAPWAGANQGTISSPVGGGVSSWLWGDGGNPRSAFVGSVTALAPDGSGGYFFATSSNCPTPIGGSCSTSSPSFNSSRIGRVFANNTISTVASFGGGGFGCGGIGGPASAATFSLPSALALGPWGELYVAEAGAHVVRRLDGALWGSGGAAGVYAGACFTPGASGDGGSAVAALLTAPAALALHPWNFSTLLIGEAGRVRAVAGDTGIITLLVGGGAQAWNGASALSYYSSGASAFTPALSLALGNVSALAFDACGSLFFADAGRHAVWKVFSANGSALLAAGSVGTAGDGSSTSAQQLLLSSPSGLAVDPLGNLLVSDAGSRRVRRFTGTGWPAALPCAPPPVTGTISTFAGRAGEDIGSGPLPAPGIDAWAAYGGGFQGLGAIAVDPWGGVLFAQDFCVRRLNVSAAKVALVAGVCLLSSGWDGVASAGDGGPATAAKLNRVMALAANASGTFLSEFAGRLRFVNSASGLITSVAGNGTSCSFDVTFSSAVDAGSALPATAVCLGQVRGLAWNRNDTSILFLTDTGARVIRALLPASGTIFTLAGTASGSLPLPLATGNGAPWRSAPMSPSALACDPSTGRLLFLDTALNQVRVLWANGSVGAVAGSDFGAAPSVTAGAPALSTPMQQWGRSLAFDGAGRLLIGIDTYAGGIVAVTGYAAAGGGVLSSRLNIVINSFFSFDLMNRITLLFSNFTMIFSDLFNFLNYGSGKLNLGTSPNFSGSSLLVIPQAWTLGLEISFYILAPFLLSSKSKIVISTITFFLITLFSQIYGIGLREPWDYRFLPFSAIYFMLGAVSQKFIADTRRVKIQRWKCNILVVLCLATSLGYFLIPNSFKIYAQQVYLLQIFLSLPFLFEFSKCYNLDRKIGELSYPVYLLHILVIDILFDFETYFYGGTNSFLTFLLCVPICIMFSIFVNRFIARPVDEFRKKHFKLI